MDVLEYLITYYDVSDERAKLLVQANPGLTGSEIATKEALEELEFDLEAYGGDKCD